mmetsp:Transcript_86156/g.238812  ORF Transcript_86156/g.238812 Transcript_86156/m.238812 type:complete len:372 (-) Transcript_86156:113-1228(-)
MLLQRVEPPPAHGRFVALLEERTIARERIDCIRSLRRASGQADQLGPLEPVQPRVHLHEDRAPRREHDLGVARPEAETHSGEHLENVIHKLRLDLTLGGQQPVPLANDAIGAPGRALPLGVNPDSNTQVSARVGDCVYDVLGAFEELLQHDHAVDAAIGVHLPQQVLGGCSYVVLALAEKHPVAARAAGGFGNQRPLSTPPRPLQQLRLAAREDLLSGRHSALSEALLHLRLVLPGRRQLCAVRRGQAQRLRQLVRELDTGLTAGKDGEHLVGQPAEAVQEVRQALKINRLNKVLLVGIVSTQEEAAKIERRPHADDWQVPALQLIQQETPRGIWIHHYYRLGELCSASLLRVLCRSKIEAVAGLSQPGSQ